MNSKKFSQAMSELDRRYVDEAAGYKKAKKSVWAKTGVIAACLALIVVVAGIFAPFHGGMEVSAHVLGTDEEIPAAGAVMHSGTISDTGKMRGCPLKFYLSGKDIASVRFSCKNQQINFIDWTEKREEYGNAQNFTVVYGEDESEYYYLTIDWVPNTLIRELTDHKESRITTLPEEMRHDVIVMEITFENGETATKAISISLLDDGTFFACFGDYEISEADTFVNRPDSEAIPREILYRQGDVPVQREESPSDGTPDTEEPAQKEEWSAVNEPAENAARAYYKKTVFEVVSLELMSGTENEVTFSVCVSRGGVIQEPDRRITLQLNNGIWEVVNEGY